MLEAAWLSREHDWVEAKFMDQCLTQQGKDEPKDPTWDLIKDEVHSFPLTPGSHEIYFLFNIYI